MKGGGSPEFLSAIEREAGVMGKTDGKKE